MAKTRDSESGSAISNEEELLNGSVHSISSAELLQVKSDLSDISQLEAYIERSPRQDTPRRNNEEKVVAERTSPVEDFIRNFLIKSGFERTLLAFQSEWYEHIEQRKLRSADEPIPDIYLQHFRLEEELNALRKEFAEEKLRSNETMMTWDKLRRERDVHRRECSRLTQEKDRVLKELGRMREEQPVQERRYQDMLCRYETAVRERMLIKLEKERLIARIAALEKTRVPNETSQPGTPSQVAERTSTAIPPPLPVVARPENPVLARVFPSSVAHRGHTAAVGSVRVHPSKPFIVTASDDRTWKVWSLPRGELIVAGEGHRDWVAEACFHPRGTHLASVSGDCTLKIWDLSAVTCAATFTESNEPLWGADFHFAGDLVLSCGADQTCRLYDLPYARQRHVFRGHADSVRRARFARHSATIFTASADKTLSQWDLRTGVLANTFYGHLGAVPAFGFCSAEQTLVSVDAQGEVIWWDVRRPGRLGSTSIGPQSANAVGVDPSGRLAFVGCDDHTIKVVELAEGKAGEVLRGHEDCVLGVAIAPEQKSIVSSAADGSFRVWG